MIEEGLFLFVLQERHHDGVEELLVPFIDKEVELVGCMLVVLSQFLFCRQLIPFEDEVELLDDLVAAA